MHYRMVLDFHNGQIHRQQPVENLLATSSGQQLKNALSKSVMLTRSHGTRPRSGTARPRSRVAMPRARPWASRPRPKIWL